MGEVNHSRVLRRPVYMDLAPGEDPGGRWDTVELKMDGIWGQLIVEAGRLSIWSRHGQCKLVSAVTLPDMVLHGEFMHGSQWANLRGLGGTFHAFDCVSWRGRSLASQRLGDRQSRRDTIIACYQDAIPVPVSAVIQKPAGEWRSLWDQYVMKLGYEGLVFKHSDDSFGFGQWGRMKRVYTVDYVFMGCNLSEADKYRGRNMAQSIVAGLYVGGALVKVANIPGLSDQQRAEFMQKQAEYVGRVFEASGRGLHPGGGLRHGHFDRWRLDKPAIECTPPHLPGLPNALL